jgi:16S rRNA (cytidine1402-2'-O)-methyltransferase
VSTVPGLLLVSTPIGNLGDLSPRAVEALRTAALICCEDTRRTGKLLQHAGISGVRMAVTNDHTEHARLGEVIDIITSGGVVALVSDAGTPGISDPGERLARGVLAAGLPVSAVPGPAALVMALVISGFDTTRFVFEGFLPRSGGERTRRIEERTITDLATICGRQRRVALGRELTKLHEECWRGTLGDAIEHLSEIAPRGEYVVVIEGATVESGPVDDDTIRVALVAEIERGADRKAAIATVMAALRLPKRRVYDIATSLPRAARGGATP